MDNTFFFFRDKRRFLFFVKCLAIGLPILIIAALAVNYYESSRDAAGVANSKGGFDYYYRSTSGTKELPEPIAKLLPMYPEGKVTYINVNTDSRQKLSGDIVLFTNDDVSKIATFYNAKAKILESSETAILLNANGQEILIDKETIQDDDPTDWKNKFRISFRD